MGSEWMLGRLASGGCELDSNGSGYGCCECGDETSGSCATELVSLYFLLKIGRGLQYLPERMKGGFHSIRKFEEGHKISTETSMAYISNTVNLFLHSCSFLVNYELKTYIKCCKS
jgi:hypothetical protein